MFDVRRSDEVNFVHLKNFKFEAQTMFEKVLVLRKPFRTASNYSKYRAEIVICKPLFFIQALITWQVKANSLLYKQAEKRLIITK